MSTLNSTTDRTLPRLQPRFQPDEAIGAIVARSVGLPEVVRLDVVGEVAFEGVSGPILERHAAQRAGLRALADEGASEPRGLIIDVNHACVCYDVDPLAQSIRSINGEPIFRPRLYLFNIVIAFEWEPSPQSIQQVRLAARQASDFLYDVTDGYMAIGQVLIGGAECLEGADIQILASNRIHPRSWIAALYQEQKYQPIRVGRGLWRKNLSATLSWDQPDGYRTLIHEWGHYALGLIDEYLSETLVGRQQRGQRRWKEAAEAGAGAETIAIVAPAIALPVNSIMATLDASELVPRRIRRRRNTRDYVRRKTGTKYMLVDERTALAGPARLQLDLPEFPQVPALRVSLADRQLTPEELDALVARATGAYEGTPEQRRGLLLGNCWVYLLKEAAAGTERLIAQGTIGEREWSDGFRVLGATEGDQVLVISQVADDEAPGGSRLSVVCGPAAADLSDPASWSERTPSPEQQPVFVDVLPAPQYEAAGRAPSQVRVLVEGTEVAPQGAVYVAGKPGAALRFAPIPVDYPGVTQVTGWLSEPVAIAQLDGHVLLRWAGEPERLLVSSFSHGGGPGTQGGGRVPVTAGSAEGNAMLFFNDNREPVDSELNEPERAAQVALAFARPALKSDEGVRIITTMNQGGQQRLANGEEARSYVFSLACNRPLPLEDRATLVLYYDDGTRKSGGDLLIYRWSGRGWERLTTFAPDRQPYVAIPLHQGGAAPEVAGGVSVRVGRPAAQHASDVPGDSLYVERYRVYWTPAS